MEGLRPAIRSSQRCGDDDETWHRWVDRAELDALFALRHPRTVRHSLAQVVPLPLRDDPPVRLARSRLGTGAAGTTGHPILSILAPTAIRC